MAEAKVYIDGEIVSSMDGITAHPVTMLAHLREQLEWQRPFDSIHATINSCGGSAAQGLAMKDLLLSYGVPIHTYGIGQVASIATAIFAAGTTRQLAKHCKFFIHLPNGGVGGTADEILAYGEATKQLENELIDIYEQLTGQPREVLFNLCQKQTELSAQQALDYGFATSVAEEVTAKHIKITDLPLKPNPTINKEEPMTENDRKEVKNLFAELTDSIKKALNLDRKEVKNLLELTDEATGQKVSIDTEGSNAVADAKVTWAESGDPLPDGSYKLSNGQTITVAGGVITAVAEEQTDSEEVTALKERLSAIEAENAELKASKEGAEQTAKANEEKVNTLTEEVKAMKATTEKLAKLMGSNGGVVRDENKSTEEKTDEKPDPVAASLTRRKERKASKN
jgi:ATP-dependent Clp protease, protease subunit